MLGFGCLGFFVKQIKRVGNNLAFYWQKKKTLQQSQQFIQVQPHAKITAEAMLTFFTATWKTADMTKEENGIEENP